MRRYGPRYPRGGMGQVPGNRFESSTQPTGPEIIGEDFYSYAVRFEDLDTNDSATGFIQIEADADFQVQKMTYFTNIDATAVTLNDIDVPLVTVVIVDTGSGRQLMNQAIPVTDIFGDGRLPFIIPTPKLFVKNSRINFDVFNFGSQIYVNLWLVLTGKKVFTRN
jgi:hypothetical protein